jgi:hypothetical protein
MAEQTFRFERFADAASARSAFEAVFPPGSPAEPALQALTDIGAQCKSMGTGRVVCRYIERGELAGWCWHLVIAATDEKTIRRVGIAVTALAL